MYGRHGKHPCSLGDMAAWHAEPHNFARKRVDILINSPQLIAFCRVAG